MPVPFDETTWSVRSNANTMLLNGVYSGIVTGLGGAVYDPVARYIQAFGRQAHHFQGFANMAQVSLDDGVTWTTMFNNAQDPGFNKFVFNGFSLAHPSLPSPARLHYQIRCDWTKAFLVASGELPVPGNIAIYMSEGGVNFSKLQDLHTWPAINQIGGNGGAALFNVPPSCTNALLVNGFYWMVSSFNMEAGGASNRTIFSGTTLWRSVDGLVWENVKNLVPSVGLGQFAELILGSSGRVFLVQAGAGTIFWTDDGDDLINAVWTSAIFSGSPGVRGSLIPMFGGTWLTFSQGTLTGPGGAWISCDDGANFSGTGQNVVPQNQTGFMGKLGPSEALVVSPSFANPATETTSGYSNNGGEIFEFSEPWIISSVGESPVMLGLRTGAKPIVMTRTGTCYVSSDHVRGTVGPRSQCPLANAGIAPAGPLPNCGHPLHVDSCP